MKPTDQHLGHSLKRCSFSIAKDVQPTHIPHNNVLPFPSHATSNSQHEVFLKTLAFYCALLEHGCLFAMTSGSDKLVDTTASIPESGDDNMGLEVSEVAACKGHLVFLRDIYHRPFIQ